MTDSAASPSTMRPECLLLDSTTLASERALLPTVASHRHLSIVDLPESLTPEHGVEASLAVPPPLNLSHCNRPALL